MHIHMQIKNKITKFRKLTSCIVNNTSVALLWSTFSDNLNMVKHSWFQILKCILCSLVSQICVVYQGICVIV